MKITILKIALLFQVFLLQAQQGTEQDPRVAALLKTMSVEEKVGQMTQINLGVFMTNDQLDIEKLRNGIVNKNIGSILNANKHAFTIEQWTQLITTVQDMATKESSAKIPILCGIDAIHGTTYTQGSTLFPHNIGMAATRNPSLVKQAAKITAMEVRASGIRWNFDPTLGVGRQPLWSRFEETFGEDSYLTSVLGGSAVAGYEENGLQSTTAVASCMKHFMGYSVPLSGKDRTPSYIPTTQLKEIFLPPFEAAVKNGTSTVMINSGEVNGVPVHASSYYLQDILRDELGFKGLAVTDWEDIIRLHTRHRVASTPKEAVKIAINAGIDMSMVPVDYSFYDLLVALVKEGEVPMTRIDEAVGRILQLKFDLGLFENPYTEKEAVKNFGKKEYKEVALEAALESITLLKNENNILPLSKKTKILLMGPTANNYGSLHGAWSYTWQGKDEKAYGDSTETLRDAFSDYLGKRKLISNATNVFDDKENTSIDYLNENAPKADVIVLAIGESAYAESPGSIHDLNLPANQIALAKAAYATGKPVILLLAEGRPRVISEIVEGAAAVLNLYRPASQGALATTQIVFGEVNPSGVLPFSYPKHAGDVVPYDRKGTDEVTELIPDTYGLGAYDPQWGFGFGMSYTSFEYGDLTLNKTKINIGEDLHVSIPVTNTGKRSGKVSVDLYVSDHYASVTPSLLKLKRFTKVALKPGETTTLEFVLKTEDLSFIDAQGNRIVEPGTFSITVAGKRQGFTLAIKE